MVDEIVLLRNVLVRQRSAYSLFEILVAISLLAILLGLALANLRPATTSSQANSLANIVAQALRAAQQRAIAQGVPVGIAIPFDAATPISQSFYWLEGEHHPKITRVQQMGGDLPESCLAAISYPGPVPAFAAGLPDGLSGGGFHFENWEVPHPTHKTMVFLPNGEVLANFEHQAGRYVLVVGNGIECSGNTLTKVCNPYVVSVNMHGQVTVDPGLPQGAGGLIAAPASLSVSKTEVASAPNLALGPNHDPQWSSPALEVEPPPIAQSRTLIAPAQANYTVAPDGTLTLTTSAKDPDGDPLKCRWTGTGPSGRSGGYFSSSAGYRMRWDTPKQHWVGRWSWKPPQDALPGEIYKLECTIEDGRGGVLSTFPVNIEIPQVFVLRAGRLVYTSGQEIWQCNWDGTDAVRIVRRPQIGGLTPISPKWSKDGSKFSFLTQQDGGIWVANRDGRDLHRVRATFNNLTGVAWHSSGHTLFLLEHANTDALLLRGIDPALRNTTTHAGVLVTGPTISGNFDRLSQDPSSHLFISSNANDSTLLIWRSPNGSSSLSNDWKTPTFTPDGKEILFFRGNNRLVRQKVSIDPATQNFTLGTSQTAVLAGLGQLSNPVQSPDGQYVLCQSTQGADIKLVLLKADGTSPRTIPLPSNRADSFDWSWY